MEKSELFELLKYKHPTKEQAEKIAQLKEKEESNMVDAIKKHLN